MCVCLVLRYAYDHHKCIGCTNLPDIFWMAASFSFRSDGYGYDAIEKTGNAYSSSHSLTTHSHSHSLAVKMFAHFDMNEDETKIEIALHIHD